MMHHMMYTQARGEFEAIAQAAPDCAMAHWGVATTLYPPFESLGDLLLAQNRPCGQCQW